MIPYFKDIPGRQAVKNRLRSAAINDQLPHALMFTGEEGSGALAMAVALARFVHCEQPGDEDACGQCASCRQWDGLSHPDIHFSYPIAKYDTKEKKRTRSSDVFPQWKQALLEQPFLTPADWLEALEEDKKTLAIHREEAEALHKDISLKSYYGGYRCAIVWRPELFNNTAANLLLKVIEEPGDRTLLLFVTARPDDVLTTIVSRTQTIKVPNANPEDVAPWLESCGAEPELAQVAASAANGNVRMAQMLIRQAAEGSGYFERFRDWMRVCFARDLERIQGWSEENGRQGRESIQHFLQYGLNVLRQCIWVRYVGDTQAVINHDEKKFIEKFAGTFPSEQRIYYLAEKFESAIADVLWNGNARVVLNDLSFQTIRALR